METGDDEQPLVATDESANLRIVDISLVEKSTISKLNSRILCISCSIIFFAYMDRGNVGLAASDVCEDLKLSHKEYGIGVGMFFIGYVISQLFSNILLKRFGAPVWLSTLLGSWGLIAMSFAFIQKPEHFYVLRILLGLAEGGTFPGIWYHMTLFYPDKYLTQLFSCTVAATYISIPIAIPIAAGLLQLDGFLGVEGWRHLFFIEGVLPVCFSLVVFFALPRSFDKASFLTKEEKDWIVSEIGADREQKANELSTLDEVKTVLTNGKFWVWASVTSLIVTVFQTLNYWLTLIIKDMLDGDDDEEDDKEKTCGSKGKHKTAAILLTSIPYILGFIACLVYARLLHRSKNQQRILGLIILGSGLTLLSWVLTKHIGFSLGFISLTIPLTMIPVVLGPVVSNVVAVFDQSARSAALALVNSVNLIGAVWMPPVLGILVDSHGYSVGIATLSGLALSAAIIALNIKMLDTTPSTKQYES